MLVKVLIFLSNLQRGRWENHIPGAPTADNQLAKWQLVLGNRLVFPLRAAFHVC